MTRVKIFDCKLQILCLNNLVEINVSKIKTIFTNCVANVHQESFICLEMHVLSTDTTSRFGNHCIEGISLLSLSVLSCYIFDKNNSSFVKILHIHALVGNDKKNIKDTKNKLIPLA